MKSELAYKFNVNVRAIASLGLTDGGGSTSRTGAETSREDGRGAAARGEDRRGGGTSKPIYAFYRKLMLSRKGRRVTLPSAESWAAL